MLDPGDSSDSTLVQALGTIDVCLHLAGAVALAVWAAGLSVRGKWREPLAGIASPQIGPGPIHLILVIATYLCGAFVLTQIVVIARYRLGADVGDIAAGSAWWHLVLFAEHFAKLSATLMAALFLGTSWTGGRARTISQGVLWVGGGVLVLLALTTLQHIATVVVLDWAVPTFTVPEHPVLAALSNDPLPPWGAVHLAIQATLVAGLCEEVFFRGLLLGMIWRAGGSAWIAIVSSALAFGLVHLSVPQTILPLVTMGLVLGYVRVRTGSLSICILLHILFNARTMALAILAPESLGR